MLRYELLNVYAIGSLILATVYTEGLIVGPMNKVVVDGSRTTLNCSSSSAYPLFVWRSPNGNAIAYSSFPGSQCVTIPSYVNLYNVSAPSIGSSYCNLIILNATSAEAGSYSCSDGEGVSTAMLLVLDSPPRCASDAVNDAVVYPDNNHVTMNCSVQFNSTSGWIPSLQWSPTSPPSSGTSYPNINTAYSSLTYITQVSTPIPSYTCSVVYNSLVYVDIPPCSTNQVNVFWRPYRITIYGASANGSIDHGASLVCSVSANPDATYQWFNYTEPLYFGPSIRIIGVGNYTCFAWNMINGRQFSTALSQNIVAVTNIPVPTSSPISSTSTNGVNDTAAIVLGVLLGLSLILNLIFIPLFLRLKKITRAGKQNLYESPRIQNNPQEVPSTTYTSLELYANQTESKDILRDAAMKT